MIKLKTRRERDFWERTYLTAMAGQYGLCAAPPSAAVLHEDAFSTPPTTIADHAVAALRERMPGPGEVPESYGQ